MSWSEVKKINSDLSTPLNKYMERPSLQVNNYESFTVPQSNDYSSLLRIEGKGVIDFFHFWDESWSNGAKNIYLNIYIDGVLYDFINLWADIKPSGYNQYRCPYFGIVNLDTNAFEDGNGNIFITPSNLYNSYSTIHTTSSQGGVLTKIIPASAEVRTLPMIIRLLGNLYLEVYTHGLHFEESFEIKGRASQPSVNAAMNYVARILE